MLPTLRSRRGFSLVELVVVTAVMGVLSVIVTAGLDRTQDFATSEMSRTAATVRSSSALEKMRRELTVARVDAPVASGTRVRFMLPIDVDGDGLVYDKAGEITWGYGIDGVAQANAAAWYSFVADQVITEAQVALDLNRDGDQADTFDVGHIEQQLPDGRNVRLTGSWVLQPLGNPGGDLDNDAVPDPLFEVEETSRAKLVRLRFTGVHRLGDGAWERSSYDAAIRLQNDAP